MPSFSPALIQTMRAALDEMMTKIPLEQPTPGINAAQGVRLVSKAWSQQPQTKFRPFFRCWLECRARGQMSRNHRTVLGLLAFWALIVVAWAMIGG